MNPPISSNSSGSSSSDDEQLLQPAAPASAPASDAMVCVCVSLQWCSRTIKNKTRVWTFSWRPRRLLSLKSKLVSYSSEEWVLLSPCIYRTGLPCTCFLLTCAASIFWTCGLSLCICLLVFTSSDPAWLTAQLRQARLSSLPASLPVRHLITSAILLLDRYQLF